MVSATLLTAGFVNLTIGHATEVLTNDLQPTSQVVSFENFKTYFDRNYAYQASHCAELEELQVVGDHIQRMKNIFDNIDAHFTEDEESADVIYARFLLAYIREGAKWAYKRGGPINREERAAQKKDNKLMEELGYNEKEFIASPRPLFTLFEKLDPISQKIINYLEQSSSNS